jgi:hypothetical protein
VDLIVLSHYHGDHFDDVATRDLGFPPGGKGEARLTVTSAPRRARLSH